MPLYLFCILILLAACGGNRSESPNEVEVPIPQSDEGQNSLTDSGPPTGAEDENDQTALRIWAPPFFALTDQETDPLGLVHQQLAEESGLQVEITHKAESGRASLLAYLRTASQAAPAVLPDILLLTNGDLRQAIDEGLLAALTDPAFEFLPAANEAVRRDGLFYAIPFLMDIEHLVYAETLTETPPTSLGALLDRGLRFLFFANSNEGFSTNYLLLLYAAEQADETTEPRSPERLRALYTFLARGSDQELVARDADSLSGYDSVWARYADGETDLILLPSSFVFEERRRIEGLGFAPLPTFGAAPLAATRVWSFVILADSPSRQALAQEYIERLLQVPIQQAFGEREGMLPARWEAIEDFGSGDPYLLFLANLAEDLYALPNSSNIGELGRRLHQAQRILAQAEGDIDAAIDELLQESP